MSTDSHPSDEEILNILNEAADQYRQYMEVRELCELTEMHVVEDYSKRSMNYPLGIVWQGRGNGILERTTH